MGAVWYVVGALLMLGLGALLVREQRGVADLRRRQRVEGWLAEYSRARRPSGTTRYDRHWSASLADMSLREGDSDFELRRVEELHPDGPSGGAIGRWLQLETPESWARRCWLLHDGVRTAQQLRSSARRALRQHLATRPGWERADDDVARVLEDAHELAGRLELERPSVAEAAYLWDAEALVRDIELRRSDNARAVRAKRP